MTKDKKRKRNLLLMISALVILFGIMLFVKIQNNEGESEKIVENEHKKITELSTEQITSVSYKYFDGEMINYQKLGNLWMNKDDSDFPLSNSAFENQFIGSFLTLTTDKKIEDSSSDPSLYGFDDPTMILEIGSVDGEVYKYIVGDYNPSIGDYYFQIQGDDSVYMITGDLMYICRDDIYDYATVGTFPQYSVSNLDYLEFDNEGTKLKLLYKEDGYETNFTGQEVSWFFSDPFLRPRPCEDSRMGTFASDVISVFAYTKTCRYNATDEELKEYGLIDSETSYTIHYNEEQENGSVLKCSTTVVIGNADESGNYYYTREITRKGLSVESSRVVSLVDKYVQESIIGLDPLDYIYLNEYFVNITDILNSKMVFNSPDKEYTFEYSKESEAEDAADIYKVDGKVIDEDIFEDFYYHITRLWPERIVYDKSLLEKAGDVLYSIKAYRNSDDYFGDTYVEFLEYDTTYYLVKLNGVADTLINIKDVKALFEELDGLVN